MGALATMHMSSRNKRQPEEVFWGTTQAEGGQKNTDWSPSQSGDQARDRLPTLMRKPVSEEKDSQVFGNKNRCTDFANRGRRSLQVNIYTPGQN